MSCVDQFEQTKEDFHFWDHSLDHIQQVKGEFKNREKEEYIYQFMYNGIEIKKSCRKAKGDICSVEFISFLNTIYIDDIDQFHVDILVLLMYCVNEYILKESTMYSALR